MKKSRAKKPNVVKNQPGVESGGPDFLSASKIFSESRLLFLIAAATVLVYTNSLSGAFVFDDTMQIMGNSHLHT